jgi:hypothetical protein
MSRRRRAEDSSLELLLDTITNTFGGILFIAILVALLLQTTGREEQAAGAATPPPMSAAEVAALEVRLEDLRDRVMRLQKAVGPVELPDGPHAAIARRVADLLARVALAVDERAHATLATADLQRQMAVARNAAERMAAEAARREREQAAELAAEEQKVAERATAAGSRHDAARRDKAEAEAEAAELTRRLVELEEAAQPAVIEQTAGLPALRPTTKQQVSIYVRFGRVFMTHVWRNGERLGPNPAQFVVLPGDPPVAQPKPTTGAPIERRTIREEVRGLLAAFPPDRWVVAVIVFDDSFAEFQWIKKAIVDMGYQYVPFPVSPGEGVYDSGGSAVAQ